MDNLVIIAFVIGLIVSLPIVSYLISVGLGERTKKEKSAKESSCPITGLPDIETKTFEHRVATLEVWRKNHNSDWTPKGEQRWILASVDPSLERKMHSIDLDSEINRMEACYQKLLDIKEAKICPSGYRYLVLEYYHASMVILDLVEQAHRLMKLKDLAGDELLPNEKLDPVLSKIFSGIDLIIERHFEGELLELFKMAIVEQLGASDEIRDRLPPGNTRHITTAEEIVRLESLISDFLAGTYGNQPIALPDIYPERVAVS